MRRLVFLALVCSACQSTKGPDEPLPALAETELDDADRLREMADQLELDPVEFEDVVRSRGARDETGVWVLYPRDNVRPEDLVNYRVDIGTEFAGVGTLEFRQGSTVLHTAPFSPLDLSTTAPVPAAVRDAVAAKGGTVTWGFFPEKGKAVTAKFTVVRKDSSLDRRLKSLDKRLRDQPPVVKEQMLAQLFLNKGYYMAALNHAWAALAIMKDAPQAAAVLQGAARRMDLEDTPLWDEVVMLVEAVPPEKKGRFQRPGGPGQGR